LRPKTSSDCSCAQHFFLMKWIWRQFLHTYICECTNQPQKSSTTLNITAH
jgi:hypothetical protein